MFIFILSNFLVLLNLFLLLRKTLKFRYVLKKTIIIFIFAFVILYLVNITGLSLIKTIFLLIIYLILIILLSQESFLKKVLVFFFFCLFSFISEIVSANIMNLLTGLSDIIGLLTLDIVLAVILSNFILFLLCHILIKLYNLYDIANLPKFSWIILVLPCTTLLLILNIDDYFYLFRYNILLALTILGLIASNFITIFIFYRNLSSLNLKNELVVSKINEKHYKKLITLLNNHYTHNFTFTHDILKKTISLKNDFDRQIYSSSSIKLNELVEISFKQFNMIFSNSSIVNSLLNENIDLLKKFNISFTSTIEFNDFAFLTDFDEYRLFNSLMQLSIEATIKNVNNKKDIILKTKKFNQQILIKIIYPITNSTVESINIINEIKGLTKKYNGIMSIKKEVSDFYEELIILFPNQYNNSDIQ